MRVYENCKVEVSPTREFWQKREGYARRGELARSVCEEIAKEIRRHVDNVDEVSVISIDPVCEHCGMVWTEDSREYNGGCCKEDEAALAAGEG